jgi:hypothetical protein
MPTIYQRFEEPPDRYLVWCARFIDLIALVFSRLRHRLRRAWSVARIRGHAPDRARDPLRGSRSAEWLAARRG